jgi:uncharacterized membrane protein YqiK
MQLNIRQKLRAFIVVTTVMLLTAVFAWILPQLFVVGPNNKDILSVYFPVVGEVDLAGLARQLVSFTSLIWLATLVSFCAFVESSAIALKEVQSNQPKGSMPPLLHTLLCLVALNGSFITAVIFG